MLTLTEKEKKAIIQAIKDKLPELASKYPESKFPDAPYEEWKKAFADPKSVQPDDIRLALEWKFGHFGGKNDVKSHKAIIAIMQEHWDTFCLKKLDAQLAFQFWREKLAEHPYFIPAAFIAHLIHSDDVEIIDKAQFRAMNELMLMARPDWQQKERPVKFDDLQNYSSFVQLIVPKLGLDGDVRRQLDKFLLTFGSRYPFIAHIKEEKKIEDDHFSWDGLDSERFDFSKIKHRRNADRLFARLLQKLEERKHAADRLTIGEIATLVPIGTAGIRIYASYQYAMISLFTKKREYFHFEDNPDLADAFTRQANNPSRDINFWRAYVDETVTINSEFLRQSEGNLS